MSRLSRTIMPEWSGAMSVPSSNTIAIVGGNAWVGLVGLNRTRSQPGMLVAYGVWPAESGPELLPDCHRPARSRSAPGRSIGSSAGARRAMSSNLGPSSLSGISHGFHLLCRLSPGEATKWIPPR